jgi:hypothetical protein
MGTMEDIHVLGDKINKKYNGIMYSDKRSIIAAPGTPTEVARLDGSGAFNKAWVEDMLTSISLVDGGLVGSSGDAWALYRKVTGFDQANHHLHITTWFNHEKYERVRNLFSNRLIPLIESGEIEKPRNAYLFSKRITFTLLIEEVFDYHGLTADELDELSAAVINLLNQAVTRQNVKIWPRQSQIDALRNTVESYFDRIIMNNPVDSDNLANNIRRSVEEQVISKNQAIGLFVELIIAGHDTTSSALVWGLHSMFELGEDVPQIHGIDITEHVKKDSPAMVWINQFLNNHPPSPIMFRQTTRDCHITVNGQDYPLKEGAIVVFLVPSIIKDSSTPYLAAFSKGIRMCAGFPMALLELISCFDLIQKYGLTPVFDGEVFGKSAGGIDVPSGAGVHNFYFKKK